MKFVYKSIDTSHKVQCSVFGDSQETNVLILIVHKCGV